MWVVIKCLIPHRELSMSFLKVLRLLIKLYESVPNPDWVNICQCLMFLDDSQEVAKILHTLIEGTEVRHQPGTFNQTTGLYSCTLLCL